MLLTRSRLCPRPKPGSSLHLHVLGTPPAFVLSQDQTLREELLETGRQRQPASQRVVEIRAPPKCDGPDPGLSLVGPGPCVLTRGSMYTTDPGTQDGVSIWHRRRPAARKGRRSDGVEPGHTPRPRFGRRVRMLLSFQRPSHLAGRGFLPRARPRFRPRSGHMSIAPGSPSGQAPRTRAVDASRGQPRTGPGP